MHERTCVVREDKGIRAKISRIRKVVENKSEQAIVTTLHLNPVRGSFIVGHLSDLSGKLHRQQPLHFNVRIWGRWYF